MSDQTSLSGVTAEKLQDDGAKSTADIAVAEPAVGELSSGGGGAALLARLYLRRWTILLASVILLSLTLLYKLPWEACLTATAVFAGGAALLPRPGLTITPRPIYLSRTPAMNLPDAIASVIEALPEPALVLSKEGMVLVSNSKAHELFEGLKAKIHISSAIRIPKVLDAVEDCGPNLLRQIVYFTVRLPVERHMSLSVSYLDFESDASPPAIFLQFRDLTEQLHHDQLRADFIANASHEIKTPLASLVGFIETLQGAARHDDDARERFLAIMAKQAERMARLIDNLMSLSRIEMRAHLRPQDTIQIVDLVQQVHDALEPMAAEADIEVELHSTLRDENVLGDRDELTQVFLNLIHNAIKYGRPGGQIRVWLGKERRGGEQARLKITIEDNGPGIAPQHLPRLTERFYRVPDADTFEKGGTGLGLAIVKHVLNRHRGELFIESELGMGSKFTVYLSELKQ